MLYAFRWNQEGWVKLGWGKDPMQRASDGWCESSHPTIEKYGERGLCGKLAPPHCELIGLWECKDEAEEKALHEQFNEGALKRADCHNELYEEMEWPKIYRELSTQHKPLPLQEYPQADEHMKSKQSCCGGTAYYCMFCKQNFKKAFNWKRHVPKCPKNGTKRKRDGV